MQKGHLPPSVVFFLSTEGEEGGGTRPIRPAGARRLAGGGRGEGVGDGDAHPLPRFGGGGADRRVDGEAGARGFGGVVRGGGGVSVA